MSSTQKISNHFNSYAAKEVYSNPVHGTKDPSTVKALGSAQMENFFSGSTVGLNDITSGRNDGIQNRHLSFKDKLYTEACGEHPKHSLVLIA